MCVSAKMCASAHHTLSMDIFSVAIDLLIVLRTCNISLPPLTSDDVTVFPNTNNKNNTIAMAKYL